ncbi:unnamed protein product [Brassica rapa]|uniref:F-box associated beta-propeller type 1 domain-containing protein n=1 Tax=Brassica campestris TaxID=3711 RepID=A0A3P5YGR6_BRACM|nr:unnamed protein product [Brassica rapa]VDC62015.1 unnamed protein product [Brassica rapa]
MHADKIRAVREGESMIVAVMDYNLYLTRVVLVDNEDPIIELIESRYSWGHKRLCLALGYEDKGSSRSYKFLRFIDVWSCYEIYDFDSSSWKDLDITPSVAESFDPLLRLPFDVGRDDDVTLSCVREEKLAVLITHNKVGSMEFEIWITAKIEAGEVLWSKFLSVVDTVPYPLITSKSFFIDEEKKVAMGYSKTFNIVGKAEYFKKLELAGRDRNGKVKVCSYAPSLVHIKQPGAGGSQQSDLEKQRFDQIMSESCRY